MKRSHLMILAAGCLSVASSSGYAQQVEVRKTEVPVPAAQRVEVQATETRAAEPFRAKQVLGAKVSIENNMAVGTVDDIVFDGDGYVEYLIVQNEGKLITVPWQAAVFNFQQRSAVINITPERYREIPTYTTEQYPVFTAPDYRANTYRYYGMTPAERRVERRVERRIDRRN